MSNKIILLGILVTFFVSGCTRNSITNNTNQAIVVIKQSYNLEQQVFTIEKNKLVIHKKINKFKNDILLTKYKRIFSKRIQKKDMEIVFKHLQNLKYLKNDYYGGGIGGNDLSIEIKKPEKSINILNDEVPQIKDFFNFINNFIPKNKPHLFM